MEMKKYSLKLLCHLFLILGFLAHGAPVSNKKNVLTSEQNLVGIVDIPEYQVYIFGFSSGGCTVKNYQFQKIAEYLLCSTSLLRIQKIPYNPCLTVNCNKEINIYCYHEALYKNATLSSVNQIQGYLLWPYFQIYEAGVSNTSIISKFLCEINLSTNSFDCSDEIQINAPDLVCYDSEEQMSVKVQSYLNYSIVYHYSEISCPINFTLPIKILGVQIMYWADKIAFLSTNSLYTCQISNCLATLSFLTNSDIDSYSQNTMSSRDATLFFLDKNGILLKLAKIGTNLMFSTYETKYAYQKLFEIEAGIILYQNGTNLIFYYQNKDNSGYARTYPIKCPLAINISYQMNSSSDSDIPITPCQTTLSLSDNQTESENIVQMQIKVYFCVQFCSECLNTTHCSVCQNYYDLQEEGLLCREKSYINFISAFMSFPYSTFTMKIIMADFLEELWFYEYHDCEYQNSRFLLEFIGIVNRNKFFPIFFKDLLGDAYQHYNDFRKSLGSSRKQFTSEKFLRIEGEASYFLSNTAKMYFENYVFNIGFYLFIKIIGHLLRQYPIIQDKLKRSMLKSIIIIMLLDSHIQFVTFMFFQQTKLFSATNFTEKANLLISSLFHFIICIYAFGVYPFYSYLQKKNFPTIFPNLARNSKKLFALLLLTNGARKVCLGIIQNYYHLFQLQAFLLTILNFVTFLAYKKLLETTKPFHKINTKFENKTQKFVYVSLPVMYLSMKIALYGTLTVFSIAGMISHQQGIFAHQTLDQVQTLCISSIVMICIWQLYSRATKLILEFIKYLIFRFEQPKIAQNKQEQILKETIKNKLQTGYFQKNLK